MTARGTGFALWRTGILCLLIVVGYSAPAQLAGTLFANEFSACEYYTNKAQMKLKVSGRKAEPQGPGKYLIEQLRIETFYEDGQPEMLIEAPQCLYDFTSRTAGSAGRFRIMTGDGRLVISGEGFHWQQTQSSLIISNRVSTRLSGSLKPAVKK